MGQVSFFERRLVFSGAPRALGLYRTSRGSLANEPFGAHKFLNQMRIGDSDEIAGCRRVFSYGPSSRQGANISMASLFGSAPDLRFELRSKFPVRSIFRFSFPNFQISKFPNSVCVSTVCANFVSRSESCEFGTLRSQFRVFGTPPFVGCPSARFRISANGGVDPVHPHPTAHGTSYLICWRAGCE